MSVVQSPFLESLLPEGDGSAPITDEGGSFGEALKKRRSAALERACSLSVPTTADEDWRFTDLSPLYRLRLKPAPADGQVDPSIIGTLFFPEAQARLVFVDGCFNASLSNCVLVDGILATSLGSVFADGAMQTARRVVEDRLATVADYEVDVFAATNTAHLHEAAVVHIAAGCGANAAPIHVLNVATGSESSASPRVLVVAEQGSQCTVIEDYVCVGGKAYLTNSVCEMSVAPNAEVRHIRIQREATTAFNIANTSVRLDRNARYRNWSVALGGKISRHNLNIYQCGVDIDCEINGLALITGRQLADTHSSIDHAFAYGNSRQVHKTISGGTAHAVFNGRILVREGAQQTNSSQQSRNMLLSRRASVDAKPQLEIFADDVKCAHGATVGQVDDEEVFYLKSRGLAETVARNLLVRAFASEVVERIPVRSLVSVLESEILEQTRNKES